MAQAMIDKPLVISLGDDLTPGLARAVVRNWWPWVRVATAREAIRSPLARRRAPLVILQTGPDPVETVTAVRYFRAPWRRSPVVIVEQGEGPVAEPLLRGEGVVCFLNAGEVEPELLEDLVEAVHADMATRPGPSGSPIAARSA